jgi:hypothetical protein
MQTASIDILPPEAATKSIGVTSLALKLDEGLEPATAASLREAFESYFQQADEWRAKALTIQITRPDQFREMKLARETRLALREIRINAEKTRKRLKEDSLRKGKAIDGIYNMLAFAVQPLEEHLLAQEQFVLRLEDERKAKLKADREAQLAPLGVDVTLYQLGEMDEATFANLLDTNRLAYHARQEAARKAEAERIERERIEAEERAKREAAEAAERERIRQENERLRAEKEAAEAAARAEREKAEAERREFERQAAVQRAEAEAKAKAEREARERAERELRAKQEAEAKAKADAEAAARAAAAAPDRDKLAAFAEAVRALPVPALDSELGKQIEATLRDQVAKFAAWADAQARKLNA